MQDKMTMNLMHVCRVIPLSEVTGESSSMDSEIKDEGSMDSSLDNLCWKKVRLGKILVQIIIWMTLSRFIMRVFMCIYYSVVIQ